MIILIVPFTSIYNAWKWHKQSNVDSKSDRQLFHSTVQTPANMTTPDKLFELELGLEVKSRSRCGERVTHEIRISRAEMTMAESQITSACHAWNAVTLVSPEVHSTTSWDQRERRDTRCCAHTDNILALFISAVFCPLSSIRTHTRFLERE